MKDIFKIYPFTYIVKVFTAKLHLQNYYYLQKIFEVEMRTELFKKAKALIKNNIKSFHAMS